MRRSMWWVVGLLAGMIVWGCGGKQLIPDDIQKLMDDEGGRWALKSVEAHGGIWRWRQRPYAKFDYAILRIQRGMDTTVTNRRRDTTITPRVDTLLNIRDLVTLDLKSGNAYSVSKSQSPLIMAGYNGDSVWKVIDTVPVTDSTELAQLPGYFETVRFAYSLPFILLDTNLTFQLVGELPSVDTLIKKGKEPGTFDTTLTPYTLKKLQVGFPAGEAPDDAYVFYLDGRDGRIRRVQTTDGGQTLLWFWSDQESAVGLMVGGRRLAFPADANGNVTGPWIEDMRFFNNDFPRELETDPFTWIGPEVEIPDSVADTTGMQ